MIHQSTQDTYYSHFFAEPMLWIFKNPRCFITLNALHQILRDNRRSSVQSILSGRQYATMTTTKHNKYVVCTANWLKFCCDLFGSHYVWDCLPIPATIGQLSIRISLESPATIGYLSQHDAALHFYCQWYSGTSLSAPTTQSQLSSPAPF